MRNSRRIRIGVAAAIAAWSVVVWPSPTDAHDIPRSVAIIAYVKPEGHRLRMVVRVPLEAMRDVNWPLRGPGYLEIAKIDTLLRDAAKVWVANFVHVYEGDAALGDGRIAAARVSLPSDRSFERYETAVATATGPALSTTTDLAWQQAMLDIVLDFDIASDTSRFSINPELARLGVRTTTVLHFIAPGHGERVFEYAGDPGLVRLDPRWIQAARQFVGLGFGHIMSGIDHLLFVLCLVIPFRRLRPLIGIVTAFTVAHSITLIASALGFAPTALWFPPLIEVLIAASIVYMALENIVGARIRTRWILAFGFGLVHGFGFSFALRESLQFAGTHLATSLFSFNVGVELGQLAVLVVAVPALNWFFAHAVAERMGTIILSAFVAHTAWHWMLDRGAVLGTYQWPVLDRAFALGALRLALALVILAAAVWAVREFVVSPRRRRAAAPMATEKS